MCKLCDVIYDSEMDYRYDEYNKNKLALVRNVKNEICIFSFIGDDKNYYNKMSINGIKYCPFCGINLFDRYYYEWSLKNEKI